MREQAALNTQYRERVQNLLLDKAVLQERLDGLERRLAPPPAERAMLDKFNQLNLTINNSPSQTTVNASGDVNAGEIVGGDRTETNVRQSGA